MKRQGFRPPVGEMSGYRTFVSPSSYHGIRPEQYESGGKSDEKSRWPVPSGEGREKQQALPSTPDHRKTKDRKTGPTYYNMPKSWPAPQNLPNYRTLSSPGDRGSLSPPPTKYDYNTPRVRKDVTTPNISRGASVPRVPSVQDRQKNTRGQEKRKLQLNYKKNKNKILRERKKYYRTEVKPKQRSERRIYQKLYKTYPSRYKRRGISPYGTAAERTKAWREEKDQEARRRGEKTAEDWGIWMKKTEPPESGRGQSRSLRAPDLQNHPQPGLFRYPYKDRRPNSGVRVPFTNNPSSGSGKVIPQMTDLRTHKNDFVSEVKSTPVRGLEGTKTARNVAMAYRVLARYFDACRSTTTDARVEMGSRTARRLQSTISQDLAESVGISRRG